MNQFHRVAFSLLAVIGLAACNQGADQQVAAPVEEAPLAPPADNDERAWKMYLTTVVKKHMDGIRSSPFMYYLPLSGADDFEDLYLRQMDNVTDTVARGVLPGNMLAFGSPESARMADLIVEAFANAEAGSMNDVRVLFIGAPEDEQRVAEAVQPTAAEFVFVELK